MGIVVVVARVDGTVEVEILATGMTDTVIGTWEEKLEEIKVAEVTEDVQETMKIGCNKALIHAQLLMILPTRDDQAA